MKILTIVTVIGTLSFGLASMSLAADAVKHKPFAHHAMVAKKAATPGTVTAITMPSDLDEYRKGPGLQVAQTYCLTCHSSGYVSMQPPMDAAHWSKTVTKMRKLYGAQIDDADAAKIADYLGKAYGPPLPVQ